VMWLTEGRRAPRHKQVIGNAPNQF